MIDCKENEVCENTPGSYKCDCKPGYYKESEHQCMKGKRYTIVDKSFSSLFQGTLAAFLYTRNGI